MASACSVAIATSDTKVMGNDFLRTPAVGNCVLVTVALVCTCFLVVCGVLVVREYSLASSFAETRCRLRNVTFYRQEVTCMFCAGLRDKSKDKSAAVPACIPSQFPCVRMVVVYALPLDDAGVDVLTADGEDSLGDSLVDMTARHVQHREAVMHPDSLQATGPFSQCSYSVCLRNKEDSQRAVEAYVDEWRAKKQSKFTCYYDTLTLDTVIVQKMYTTSDVIHSMLWPSLVVVACGAIFLRLEIRRRRLTLCGRRESIDGPADLVLVTRPTTHGGTGLMPPTSTTNFAGSAFSTAGDCVERRLAAARAGRAAVVYQSLPSLVHLQAQEYGYYEHGIGDKRVDNRPIDADPRQTQGINTGTFRQFAPPLNQRNHPHNHHRGRFIGNHQEQHHQQPFHEQCYETSTHQTVVRKLSASVDCFDVAGVAAAPPASMTNVAGETGFERSASGADVTATFAASEAATGDVDGRGKAESARAEAVEECDVQLS